MAFIDEVEELESKARLRKAAPLAGAGVAVLALVVVFFALSGVFGGGGDFAVTKDTGSSSQEASAAADASSATTAASSSASATTSAQSSSASAVVVYVTGAVAKPGVYSFDSGARVKDAVDAAGGFSKKADASSLNLARALVDGEQIEVLTRKQAKQAQAGATATSAGTATSASSRASASGTASGTGGTSGGKININTATSEELQTLNGIGEVTAQKIIDYRETSGPFAKPEDIKNVSGIGDKKYEAIASSICV